MDNNNKPFNKYYVLRITSLHIKKSVDTSIRKTYDRLKDVKDKQEVFETLDVLHKIRKMMEDFESHNKHLYQKPNEVENETHKNSGSNEENTISESGSGN
jgi:hypothetical protein